MAERIANYDSLPAELPELFEGTLASERVQGLPETFTSPEIDRRNLEIHNRLLRNINAVKQDLLLLKLDNLLKLEDYQGLVVFTDTELDTLNNLLLGNVLARLEALENP